MRLKECTVVWSNRCTNENLFVYERTDRSNDHLRTGRVRRCFHLYRGRLQKVCRAQSKIVPDACLLFFQASNTRLERIADELHFARTSTKEVIETTLPLSVQRDGVTSFRKTELIEDLTCEQNNIRHTLKLHFVDQELHDAHRTSSEHFECVALHGYRTYLWTADARVALEREHNRLVARLVATDIVHNILDWMLEGWHFGERPSRHKVVGYVPSMQKTGHINAGTNVQVNRSLRRSRKNMHHCLP